MQAIRIQADIIIASADRIFQPGQVVLRDGEIVHVTAGRQSRPDIDFGQCVLLPGLVNPHTHLEFSLLDQPLPPDESFPQWISEVIAYRRARRRGP